MGYEPMLALIRKQHSSIQNKSLKDEKTELGFVEKCNKTESLMDFKDKFFTTISLAYAH